ncbi:SpoIID/LytB domain protein [Oceanobacillus limi]|uniref:SpoIID/LytB domain protein n=1 Tax=Oceanobacillus limi TaxID=930131 RepID=A0A1I0BK64_9BACI|nr:SpoIID/LytB domain-containing protein [Oceanobacillus limi]SET06657.1 SpoIID/LytB domain protein [Oceanobacillus limi]
MVKKIFGLLLFGFIGLGFSTAFSSVSFAEENTQMIRIGVVPTAENVKLGSNGDFTIVNKVTGEVIYSGSDEEVSVQLDSTAEIQTNYRLQVAWTTSNSYVEDWLNRAEIGGYDTYIEPYNNGWRLYIGAFAEDAPWGDRNAFREEVISSGLAGNDSFWKVVTVSNGESLIKVTGQDFEEIISNPIQVRSDDDLVLIDGKNYRGIGEVAFNSNNTLAGINELPLEEYLYGVVPHELPPEPYNELEAQKSQAVAARTYAISGLGKRSNDGYDLLPTTSDQVYGGYEVEHPISTQAVQETSGIVATYEGELISAVYHSTSGGFTANNNDIWDSAPVDYLQGVPDAQRGKAFDNVPSLNVFKNSSNPKSLRAVKKGDFESDWSRYHRWHFEWTPDEISNVLSTYFNTEVGEVYEINVVERSNSGRVLEIEFVTENGNFYEFKDRIRWALQYINANGDPAVLLSTLFYVEPIVDKKTKELSGFEVYGGGWGHGVGLSQTGAMGMAVKGHTFDEILKHYYQGIELEERY